NGCSSTFTVSAEDTTAGAATLTAFDPGPLVAGTPFTARWSYDDGEGNVEGSFLIDLYSCENGGCDDGGCGTFNSRLCKLDDGCYDPAGGDYDVL
ncbi:unnamed protein product, partial [Choristocarpus tenellus]